MKQLSPSTSLRYFVLLLICVLALVIYIHRLGFADALPHISTTLKFTRKDVGWFSAMFLTAYALFEMPWGILVDRLGARRLLPFLVICWSLLTGGVAVAGQMVGYHVLAFWFLIGIRFFFGMFQAGAFPVISRIMADWMPSQERGFAQGCIWMSTRLGAAVLPLLLARLINTCGNWQTPMMLLAGLGVVWAVVFWLWFRNRPEEMRAVSQAEMDHIVQGRRGGHPGHGSFPWKRMLSSRSVWALCFMYGCTGFASNFYVTMLPTYLNSNRKMSDEDRSWMAGLPFLCGAAACLAGGWLSDWIIRWSGNRKLGRRFNGTVGLCLGGVGWLAIPMVTEHWALTVVLCAVFFCNDLVIGPAWAACADIGESHAGTLGGAMNMIGSLMGAAGALLAGYLMERSDAELVCFVRPSLALFAIYAGSFWLAALLLQFVDATQTLAEGPVKG